ncbi:MAG: FAD:protein FMN transferase [Acidobacteriota bacterium]
MFPPRRFFSLILSLLFVLAPSAVEAETSEPLFRFEDSRVSMACTYTIVVYGRDERQLPLIVKAAFEEVDRIDDLMSNYKPDSPISEINRHAASQPVSTDLELFKFLQACLQYSRESQGAFDITVGPLMKTWGFYRGEGRVPWFFELWDVRRKVGYQHVQLDAENQTVRFDRPGVELDLGGIAKGYAVDRVVELLRTFHIQAGFVSAGGSTMYGLGAPPGKTGWDVKIRDPLAPHNPNKSAASVQLHNQALSVSGNYEKFFEAGGKRYSHIMDPRTGRPVEGMLSVAVVTDTGTEGDALDNVLYVLGLEASRVYLQRHQGVQAFFFLPDGERKWKMVRLPGLPAAALSAPTVLPAMGRGAGRESVSTTRPPNHRSSGARHVRWGSGHVSPFGLDREESI